MQRLLIHGITVISGIGLVSLVYGTGVEFLSLYVGVALILLALFWAGSRINLTFAKMTHGLLLIPLVVLASLHADNLHSYGPLLKESIEAIFQTSNTEAISYIKEFASPRLLPITALTLVAALASLWWIKLPLPYQHLAIVGLALAGGLLMYTGRSLPLMIYETGLDYARQLDRYSNNRKAALEQAGPIQSGFKGNIVVVMGESISRHHLQAYGYPRKTTPFLHSIRDELVIYNDIISTHSHTTPSLSKALTFNRRSSNQALHEAPDILTVADEAGLDTWWLSNQNAIGVWDNIVAIIASQARQTKYHDSSSGIAMERSAYDDALVKSLKTALDEPGDSGKLIFFHTMAAHFPHCDVTPPNFEPSELDYANPPMDVRFYGNWFIHLANDLSQEEFKDWLNRVNCYDRAVSYLDSVLKKIIGILQQQAEPTAILVTADHGEAPILGTIHDSRQHSHFHVEVPYILWMNETFKDARPEINTDPDIPGSLAELSYSIAHLAGISGPEGIDSRSTFASTYDQKPRRTLNGNIGYDIYDDEADHVERARSNLLSLEEKDRQKVWAHRVNSGGKMMVAKEIFDGVEMDLVFDSKAEHFSVHHPPASDVGLTLELQLTQDRESLQYWFDWKNANRDNMTDALTRLKQLDTQFGLKARSLIEISALDGSAARLSMEGWETSYYLPTRKIMRCIDACTDSEARQVADEFLDNLEDNGFNAVSFDTRVLPFVETNMLNTLQQENIPVYTWTTQFDISEQDAPDRLQPLLDRDWIDVVLITMPSHFSL